MPKRNADQNPPETQLNARGLSLKAHYRHEFPKLVKALEAKGEGTSYFLALQQEYEEMEQHLASQQLPPGGAQEILSGMFYQVDETPGRLDSPLMH